MTTSFEGSGRLLLMGSRARGATRYDKYFITYLGGVLLGMVIMTHCAKS